MAAFFLLGGCSLGFYIMPLFLKHNLNIVFGTDIFLGRSYHNDKCINGRESLLLVLSLQFVLLNMRRA